MPRQLARARVPSARRAAHVPSDRRARRRAAQGRLARSQARPCARSATRAAIKWQKAHRRVKHALLGITARRVRAWRCHVSLAAGAQRSTSLRRKDAHHAGQALRARRVQRRSSSAVSAATQLQTARLARCVVEALLHPQQACQPASRAPLAPSARLVLRIPSCVARARTRRAVATAAPSALQACSKRQLARQCACRARRAVSARSVRA